MSEREVTPPAIETNVQSGGLVLFRMVGPALQVDISFENDVPFDPSNIGHLLAWYCSDQAARLIKEAHTLYGQRAAVLAKAQRELAEAAEGAVGGPSA